MANESRCIPLTVFDVTEALQTGQDVAGVWHQPQRAVGVVAVSADVERAGGGLGVASGVPVHSDG